jgi:integrase
MSSNVSSQIQDIIRRSGMVDIDTDYKRAEHVAELRGEGMTDWHAQASCTSITEHKTLEAYKQDWRELGKYQRDNGYGTSLRKVSPDCVRDFLQDKLDAGRSYNTMIGYLTSIGKLDAMLDAGSGHERGRLFDCVLQGDASMRATIKAEAPRTDTETRAYNDPQAVVAAIADPRCQLAAEIQLSTGLRAHDVCYIRLNDDGSLSIRSKAGRTIPQYTIPGDLSARLMAINGGPGAFHLTGYNHYRYELAKACAATGEHYTGTHALRHSYAQQSYADHRASGMSDNEAKAAVSEELFHHRLEVVDVYLR